MLRFLRKSLLVTLVVAVTVTLSFTTVAATSYNEARENKALRSQYVSELVKENPPSISLDCVTIKYTDENSETATMAVRYKPFFIGKIEVKLRLELIVYPDAFEKYVNKDDFLSTLYHEYNHLRALHRNRIVEEDNYYMNTDENSLLQLANADVTDLLQLDSKKDSKFLFKTIQEIKWTDLYNLNNYDSELLESSKQDFAYQLVNTFIKNPIMEMMAIEEEIYRHKFKLNPSKEFKESRYTHYMFYYYKMMDSLERFGASEKLTNTLINLFHRNWFFKKNLR